MVVTCLSESQNARNTNIPSRMHGSVLKVAFSQSLCRRWRRGVNDGRGPSEGAEAIGTSTTCLEPQFARELPQRWGGLLQPGKLPAVLVTRGRCYTDCK